MGLLKTIRSRSGFKLEEVAAAAGWSRARQREIEAADDLDVDEAERLSDLYGVDVGDVLFVGRPTPAPIAVLLRAQAEVLDADSRFRIAECVTIARRVRALEVLLGADPARRWLEPFRANPDYEHPSHGGPERMATGARQILELPEGPIRSVSEQILAPLSILVLWTPLPSSIDALSFFAPDTGAVIVSNPAGAHMQSAFGRRVSWAHELCHLLYDRPKLRRLEKFCAMAQQGQRDQGEAYRVERRARAFAAYLLAPRTAVERTWAGSSSQTNEARVRQAMLTFGMGYEATGSHLQNLELLRLSEGLAPVPVGAPQAWEQADPGPIVASDTLALGFGVSAPRAGVMFERVLSALERGLISEGAAREALRLPLSTWEDLANSLERTGRLRRVRTFSTSAALLG